VDYWTQELGIDIVQLKREVEHLIAVHPHVIDFLRR
jgi:putative hydrolase of the HAD superfamily